MSFVTRALRELYNGVSQQPDSQRAITQCAEMINGVPSVSKGLLKRPMSTRLVAMVAPIGWNEVKTFIVRRPTGALTYWVLNTRTNSAQVFDDTGVLILHQTSSYITGDPKDLDLTYSGDEVIILNKGITVDTVTSTLGGSAPVGGEKRSILKIRDLTENTYQLTFHWKKEIGGVITLISTTGAFSGHTTPDSLASGIKTYLDALPIEQRPTTGISVDDTSILYWDNTDEEMYFSSISSDDILDGSGYGIAGAKGYWEDVALLPSGLPNHIVKIASNKNDKGYYLKYVRSNEWIESIGYDGDTYETQGPLDPDTMPLYFEANALKLHGFDRLVASPYPQFVGDKITSMFFYQNRLALTSGKSVDFSETGVHWNFFKNSMAQVFPSDAMSLSLPDGPTQEQLIGGVPQNQSLMLFGNSSQYRLSSLDITEASLLHVGSYQVSPSVAPIDVANSTYFASNTAEYSNVSNLYQVNDVGNFAVSVENAQAPYYIKGNITIMKYSTNENILLVVSDDDPTKVFVQHSFQRGNERLQNAWHTWQFDGNVDSISIIGSEVFICLIKKGNCVSTYYFDADMEVLQISLGSTQRIIADTDTSTQFIPYLDSLQVVDSTSFPSYYLMGRTNVIGVDSSGEIYNGTEAIQAYLDSDAGVNTLYVGFPFRFYYEFSKFLPTHSTDQGKVLDTFHKLIIRKLRLAYFDSAQFIMKTVQNARDTYSQEFSSDMLGDLNANLGRINLKSGVFNFPVNSQSDACRVSIESESPYPCNFTMAEWSGNLIRKGIRY